MKKYSSLPAIVGAALLAGSAWSQAPIDFRIASVFATPSASAWIELADMDRDGDLDVVSVEYQDEVSTLSIMMNRGNGSYDPPVSYPVGKSAQNLAIGDFNGDGSKDVVVSNYLSGDNVNNLNSYVTVYMNNGTGALVSPQNLGVGQNAHPSGITVADFDGDGRDDFAVATQVEGKVFVYKGAATGTLPLLTSFNSDSPSYMSKGDFDGDGRVDLVVGNVDACTIFRNVPGGFTQGQYASNYPDGVAGVVTGDFDRDGDVDYATSGRSFTVWTNVSGVFTKSAAYGTGENLVGLASRDVDNDGDLDVVGGVYLGNMVSVYYNDGFGHFDERRDWGVGNSPWNAALGDVNGDGLVDIVAPHSAYGSSTFSVVLNAGNKEFVARREYGLIGDAAGAEIADMNGDGLMDVVTGVYVGNQDRVAVFYRKADGSLRDAVYIENIGNNIPTDVTTADFNGDGRMDIAASIFSPGNCVRVWFNQGNETFAPSIILNSGGNPSGVGAGDLNNDGYPDIVNTNGSQLDNSIYVFINNRNGTFQTGVRLDTLLRPSDAAFGDFDRDGDQDVVVTHGSANSILLFRNNGTGTLTPVNIPVGSGQGNAAVGDFDNDGWLDLLLATGNVRLLKNNHSGGFSSPVISNVGAGRVAAADLDRDGDLDMVGTSGVLNLAYVGANDGTGSFTQVKTMSTGYSPDRVAARDIDGDGKPEIAVANGRGGTVSVFTNITATPVDVAPDGFRVVRGSIVSGGLSELLQSDDQKLIVRNGPVAIFNEAPVNVEFSSVAPSATVEAMTLTFETSVNTPNLSRTLQAFDYAANAWVTLDQQNAQLADSRQSFTLTNPSRFIQPGTKKVLARAQLKQVGPVTLSNWNLKVDQVSWRLGS